MTTIIARSTRTAMLNRNLYQVPKHQHVVALSTQTSNAMAKLQAALEDYRLQNYTQEIPTRFKKDIVSAASIKTSHNNNNNATVVNVTGLQHVLHNIGASNVLTMPEMHSIFMEIGNERGEISSTKMIQLL